MTESQEVSTETESLIGQSQPAVVSTGYGSIQTPNARPSYSWRHDVLRYTPQLRSLSAASFIFMSGGMSLLTSVGFGPIAYGTFLQYCWFIAVIIGACISAPLAHKVTKRMFNLVASILVIINGIIYVVEKENTDAIICARFCDGIAFGLTLIPAILAGSEQPNKLLRGYVLSGEHTGLVAGALLRALIINDDWEKDVGENMLQGIMALCFGICAFIINFVLTIESPIFHLRNNNEMAATEVICRLYSAPTANDETIAILNENKALLDEDLTRGRIENTTAGWLPLIKIIIFRVLVSLSFSLPLTWAYSLAYSLNNQLTKPNVILYLVMRFIGVSFSTFLHKYFGRKIPSGILLLISGGLLAGVASVFSSFFDFIQGNMQSVIVLLLMYQLSFGYLAPTSTCYLSEAFSISVKPFFILVVVIIENVVQIIVCCSSTMTSTSDFAYALAALQVIFGCAFFFFMPETRNTTLREALDLFRNFVTVNISSV